MIQATGLKYEHVERAIADLQRGLPNSFSSSSKYVLNFEGHSYPPKAVLARAVFHLTGQEPTPKSFSGGEQTNKILRSLGFEIKPKTSK